jgi:hypothetical protein
MRAKDALSLVFPVCDDAAEATMWDMKIRAESDTSKMCDVDPQY